MKYSALALTTLLLLCTSTQAQTSFPNDGKIIDGVYYNKFFNFAFTYPKDWIVPDEATNERIRDRANEEATRKGNLAAMKDAYLLLTVSRHPLGTPNIAVNPGVLMAAEKVAHLPGATAKEYLLGLRSIKQREGAQATLNEPVEFRIAGFQFFRDDFSREVRGVTMKQSVFVLIKKGYALVINFIADDQKLLEEMTESMRTILPVGRGGNKP
ncbi:MAG TPA: hypothetical protein VFI24_07345 [Pyrinomonadaceae bacterium]|nr:hypothetical protein [Pyrinomonadaceae bacterium]